MAAAGALRSIAGTMTVPLPVAELPARLDFAMTIAAQAGQRLLALRTGGRWADEQVLGDVADHAADAFLQGSLLGAFPQDGVRSEEAVDAAPRTPAPWTWILDPLDGTKEYRSGRHDWAVHVGLVRDCRPVLGAVALPAIDRVVGAICVPGRERVVVQGRSGDWPLALTGDPGEGGRLRLAVSRSHTPDWIRRFAADLGDAELVPSGSVGFKVALLLFGRADVYAHKPGLKEWDTCAPEAVARAAGWWCSRLDGSAQTYGHADPRNDEIAVCRPRLRDRVLTALAAHAPRG